MRERNRISDAPGLKNILANIELAKKCIESSENTKIAVLVTGSEQDRKRWQERLQRTAPFIFNRDGSTHIFSLQEKIGEKTREGNFLGTLLAYSRLKEEASRIRLEYRDSVSLIGMLFGRGERMSPFTQIEGDCKGAIVSTASNITIGGRKAPLSEVEESLKFFMPLARYLERGGFRGILNKWGDETEIASTDLGSLAEEKEILTSYDLIKFISELKVTDDLAESKDWIIYNENSDMLAQLSRNKKDVLISQLKASGIKPHKDGEYYAGISLGPVAVSYQLLDIAEEVFFEDIRKPGACIDFDPYVIMAFAMRGDQERWKAELEKDPELQSLAGPQGVIPDFFDKINKIRRIFKDRYKRGLNLRVFDLGSDVFWTDVGQHNAMREKYLALNDSGAFGIAARRVENIPDTRDEKGNIIINSAVSTDVEIKGSVIINSNIKGKGRIENSVIKDSVLNDVEMTRAFSILSFRTGKTMLKQDSGIYKSIGSTLDNLVLEEGMRHGTLLTVSGPVGMMVAESTDLRDKDNTYNVPVFGNRISFEEAYNEMFGVSAEELEKRRDEVIDAVRRIDDRNRKSGQLMFGTSGLRDTVENMTDMECYINTRGFLSFLKKTGEFKAGDAVAIGGDRRQSTTRIKRAVAAAIRDMDGKVDDQGLIMSPALANYAMKRGISGIMVTGSHIPADRNGIKFTKRSSEVLKSDEEEILASVSEERKKVYSTPSEEFLFDEKGMFKPEAADNAGVLLKGDEYEGEAVTEYISRYTDVFGSSFLKGVKVFFYQHSAVGRDAVKTIFESLGAEVIAPESLRSPEFIPVDTESVSDKTMAIFRKMMNEKGLDIGISLDGDSDRPLLVYRVYRNGEPTDEVRHVTGDILGLLAVLGLGEMGVRINAVAVPVSANDAIAQVLANKGVEIIQTKIGSPYVIAAMNESLKDHAGASWNVFSWESNGGFLTGSDLTINRKTLKALPTRDAVLPLLSVIRMSNAEGVPISDLIGRLPGRFTYADRKKEFPVERSNAVIQFVSPVQEKDVCQVDFSRDGKAIVTYSNGKVKKFDAGSEFHDIRKKLQSVFTSEDGFSGITGINYIDGVRIFFSNGEISHLRPSGNAPEFRNYAMADTPERAKEMVGIGLEKVIPSLAEKAKRRSGQ